MRTFIVFVALFAFALAGPGGKWTKEGKGGKGKFAKMEEFKCNGEAITFPEDLKTKAEECDAKIFGAKPEMNKENMEKFKAMTKEEKKQVFKTIKSKMGCAAVCKTKAFGVAGEDGKINREAWSSLVEKSFPSSVSKDLIAAAEKCFDAQPDFVFSEETCEKDGKMYGKLMKCVGKAAMKICKVESNPEDEELMEDDN